MTDSNLKKKPEQPENMPLKHLPIVALILLTFGCSSPNCLQNGSRYTRSHIDVKKHCSKGDYGKAAAFLQKMPSEDDMLHALDLGMTEHRTGEFKKSIETFALSYPKMKLSAEAEVSGDFYSSSLNTLGSIIDQLTNSDLVGTGTYRYAYGLQLRGRSAKYHLSTPEVARVAAFQLLSALKAGDDNAVRIASLNLSDMQQFIIEYNDDFPFIDHSFNELLMLTYFGTTNDTAGNAAVANNRAVDEIERAANSLTEDKSLDKAYQRLNKTLSVFDQLYSRNLRSDLFSFAQKRKGMHSLTKSEVMSTRLVSKSSYEELKNYIAKKCITPLKRGLQHHDQTIKQRRQLISAQSENSNSTEHGTLTVVVEDGNAPDIASTNTQIKFALLKPYRMPDNSLELAVIKDGKELTSTNLVSAMDPDLLIQLDYQRYLKMLCDRLIKHIRSEEIRLCSQIAAYYSEIESIKQQIAHPQASDHLKRNLHNRLNYMVRSETSRRSKARRAAQQRIQRLRYDHRVWYSQPNKVYMSTLPNLPVGKALIQIKRDGKVIRQQSVDIKSGSITFELTGSL